MKCLTLIFTAAFAALAAHAFSQTPEWIWHHNDGKTPGNNERRFFRKVFNVDGKVEKAVLSLSVDDEGTGFVNAASVATVLEWGTPAVVDVTKEIKQGQNIIAVRGINHGSAAGVVARLDLTMADGKKNAVVSDTSWVTSAEDPAGWQQVAFAANNWAKARSVAKLGATPWGDVFSAVRGAAKGGAPAGKRMATPADALHALPDFKIELLHSAEPEEGSWVNMCKDNKGRLILSPQFGRGASEGGLLRVTLDNDGKIVKRDFIAKPLYDAQGMTFANSALWVVVNKYSTKFDSGLYRITDDGSDKWANIELIKKFPGGGEHGPHAIEPGPDGNLYVMAGNHTKLVEGIDPASPHKNYQEDHVLPRQWDGNGHAAGILAPGGMVYRVSPDGKKWELFCAGFRNQFDFAFNVDGELFTYDADMEWDWGMPWYRPTRVNHCVSGGEYGWRSGTGKWPDYYPDSLGAIDIGVGCPTGTVSGRGAKFPAKYQRALYIMDWTYGRLIAVHLKPNGASYTGTWENFVCPEGLVDVTVQKRSLNLTDMIVGDDGAMYFVIGGRNTAAGLYRVTYTGKESTAPANEPNAEGAEARKLRRQLEAFHGKADPKAIDFLWPHLNSDDRALRYAARIALEWQPVAQWKDRAIAEKGVNGGITALLALARTGGKETQGELFKALGKFPLASLTESQQLDKLRVIQLSIVRQGKPSTELAQMAISKLNPQFPSSSTLVNREMMQILVALGAPDVVAKSLRLMGDAKTQEDMVHYLFHLRTAKNWTLDQRREYFGYYTADRTGFGHQGDTVKWFDQAGRPYGDGSSFNNFYKNFRKEAVENLTDAERTALALMLAAAAMPDGKRGPQSFPKPQTRQAVKEWKTADILPLLDQVTRGRNFEKGRQAFVDAQCLACHRFGNEGGGTGPDLTVVSTRFSRRDILESITEPSKVVSEQFQNTTVVLKNGDDVTGRLVDEQKDKLILVPNPLQPNNRVEVKKSDVKSRGFSKISPMPEGLINVLSQDDILDLLAFLESAGRRTHSAFAK
jgi:putative heme-binding domain-containing protein